MHSRELIEGVRKQKKEGEHGVEVGVELHGEVVFVFLLSNEGMQPLKSSQ